MPPDPHLLKGVSRENLSAALKLKRGKKILVIDPKLIPTLDLIANYRFLQDFGVERVVHLGSAGTLLPTESVSQVLYFIKAELPSAKVVCDQVNSFLGRGVGWTYGVVVVPRRLSIISSLFESEGIAEVVALGQYAHELIPLEDTLLSLQMEDLFPQLWLHKDTSMLASVAKAIFNLRGMYGDFHHVVAMGPYAKTILRMEAEFERIHAANLRAHNRQDSEIPTIIIMDRSADLVTPLLIPLNYEGVLDVMFGIKGKTVAFGGDVTGKEDPVKHNLASDPIFEKIRHLHFSQVVSSLLSQEREIRRAQEDSAGLNLQAMKNFVAKDLAKIQGLKKTLALHLGAFEAIIQNKAVDLKKLVDLQEAILENVGNKETWNFLEDGMARSLDPHHVLRLFALATLAQDGLRDFKNMTNQFLQSYGFKHLITLSNLETAGLLYPFTGLEVSAKGMAQAVSRVASASTSPFSSSNSGVKRTSSSVVITSFQQTMKKLVPSSNTQVDIVSQNHPSYIFNGKYTPLIAATTEAILAIITAPKSNVALMEKKLEETMKTYNITDSSIRCRSGAEAYGRGRNVLVFIIGGITRGEISALQVVARNASFNVISAGTDITNGNKLISGLVIS